MRDSVETRKDRRFAVLGGFLGAGKTTAALKFGIFLAAKKMRSALITNDQSRGLVDSALANEGGMTVTEITGGCFCCRSGDLCKAMEEISLRINPEVLIGEAVGSCTDLVATVLAPLRRIYRSEYVLAPLSVVADPFRTERILGVNGAATGGFAPDVNYIHLKQLEEAEIIVVNKCDVFAAARLATLTGELRARFPKAEVLEVSVRTGQGLEAWWQRLLTRTHASEPGMEVNYAVYAEGEARLGWVNGEYSVELAKDCRRLPKGALVIDGNRLLGMLGTSIQERFRRARIEVAHLKISIEPEAAPARHRGARNSHSASTSRTGLAAIQWVRTDSEPEFTQRLEKTFCKGRLLLNLRAEADAQVLAEIVEQAFGELRPPVAIQRLDFSAFQPAPPQPTHRLTTPPMEGSAAIQN